jgi:hypothetical protein
MRHAGTDMRRKQQPRRDTERHARGRTTSTAIRIFAREIAGAFRKIVSYRRSK